MNKMLEKSKNIKGTIYEQSMKNEEHKDFYEWMLSSTANYLKTLKNH